MVFTFRQVIVSGTQEGVEGVSAALQELNTFMQDAGWSLVDDRSAEPGTNIDSTHHKIVWSSNGEQGNYPTFFVTAYSGTGTPTDSSRISIDVHSAYDVGTHTFPASGVRSASTNLTGIGSTQSAVQVRSQDDNTELYISGDSEMVALVTRKTIDNSAGTTMDSICFGRFNSFMSVNENPYPLLVNGDSTVGGGVVTTNFNSVRGIGGNPPAGFNQNNDMEVLAHQFTSNQQPYDLGSANDVWVALPFLVTYDDTSPIPRSGIAGTVRNAWVGAESFILNNLSILTASGTFGVQKYQAFNHETFSNVSSLIIRIE
ncbi:MAG: hypothetical protein GF334_01880 [Candidatus Altiarchaeales archaeon]|nr:hypothetical protein [Candidatus Altiarchaeales archaeon]